MKFNKLLFISLFLLLPGPALGEYSHRVALLGAAEMGLQPELGGHEIGLIAYDLGGLPRGATLSVELNTDTLRLRLDRLGFWGGKLELGFHLTGEALLAGLLSDYYQEGLRDPARGFDASYAAAGVQAKLNQPGNHHLELELSGRYWFFGSSGETDPGFTLPPETWVLEPRLRYTYWGIKHDGSWSHRHRLFPRVRGFAFGLSVGMDIRGEVEQWGAAGTSGPGPTDTRNIPRRAGIWVRQWALFGYQISDRVRTQVRQEVMLGAGLDDLNRARVGGLNPYVVPLAGASWASFLSDRHLALRWSWHFRLYKQLEAGVLGDLVWLADAARTGVSGDRTMAGLGLFADWQLGAFQIDLALGWCPTLDWHSSGGSLGALAALGWQWG